MSSVNAKTVPPHISGVLFLESAAGGTRVPSTLPVGCADLHLSRAACGVGEGAASYLCLCGGWELGLMGQQVLDRMSQGGGGAQLGEEASLPFPTGPLSFPGPGDPAHIPQLAGLGRPCQKAVCAAALDQRGRPWRLDSPRPHSVPSPCPPLPSSYSHGAGLAHQSHMARLPSRSCPVEGSSVFLASGRWPDAQAAWPRAEADTHPHPALSSAEDVRLR